MSQCNTAFRVSLTAIHANMRGGDMTQLFSHFEKVITQFRHMLENTATVQAIDEHDDTERIAMAVIDYGYIETADAFVRSAEAHMRRGA
jgi:hypothetical protein